MDNTDRDIYFTIDKIRSAEIKIKGSRFIGTAAHVNNTKEASDFLDLMRKNYFNATHNCYAWKIGWNGSDFRFSDDGEPNGTAGKPILFTFSKFDFSDLIVVVTRYFGGTKLGVGGLSRAYQEATAAVLETCEKVEVHRTRTVRINCLYEEINIVKRLLSQYAVSIKEDYGESIEIFAEIHLSEAKFFCDEVTRITNAKVGVRLVD